MSVFSTHRYPSSQVPLFRSSPDSMAELPTEVPSFPPGRVPNEIPRTNPNERPDPGQNEIPGKPDDVPTRAPSQIPGPTNPNEVPVSPRKMIRNPLHDSGVTYTGSAAQIGVRGARTRMFSDFSL